MRKVFLILRKLFFGTYAPCPLPSRKNPGYGPVGFYLGPFVYQFINLIFAITWKFFKVGMAMIAKRYIKHIYLVEPPGINDEWLQKKLKRFIKGLNYFYHFLRNLKFLFLTPLFPSTTVHFWLNCLYILILYLN